MAEKDRLLRLGPVDERERHVVTVSREKLRRAGADLGRGRAPAHVGEVPQGAKPTLPQHPTRRFEDGDEDAADAAVLARDRTVGEGEVALLEVAVPVERKQLVDEGARRRRPDDAAEHRTDEVPDFREGLVGAPPERRRVLRRAEDRAVGVVVELREALAPGDVHGVAGIQQDPERGLEALRPFRGVAERRARPVVRADPSAHVATAVEEPLGRRHALRRARAVRTVADGHPWPAVRT